MDLEHRNNFGKTALDYTTNDKRKYLLTIYRNKYGKRKISLCEYLMMPDKTDIIQQIMGTTQIQAKNGQISIHDENLHIDDGECSPFLNDKKNN